MLRSRLIPCLLLSETGLVKTIQFGNRRYIGDPINTVRIFNEKQADELMILDIDATTKNRGPNFELIASLASECRMPLCYGGGVSTVNEALRLVELGVEKIAISSAAVASPKIISEMAQIIGSQSVVVVLDVKYKNRFFKSEYEVRTHNGSQKCEVDLIELVHNCSKAGAGEIVINCIDNDGMMKGYNIDLLRLIKSKLDTHLTIIGGAGSDDDITQLNNEFWPIGIGVGSKFVYKGKYRAVLINYPSLENRIKKLCRTSA